MSVQKRTRILFVCLGNICRSPLAQCVFGAVVEERQLSHRYAAASAGTGAWHLGSAPDPRSVAVADRHGVDLRALKARRITRDDFDGFDLILGMDRSNVDDLLALSPPEAAGKVHLFLEFATGRTADIPDPYYGGPGGFDAIYRTIRDASEALVERLDRESCAPSGQASSTT